MELRIGSYRVTMSLLLPLLVAVSVSGYATPVDAASEGFQQWFRCGLRYWTVCQRTARTAPLPAAEPPPTGPQRPVEPVLSPAELALWGTPVLSSSGSVSYQLPPQPLLDLFRAPSDDSARAYLHAWKDKAGRREEAFAAIRRVADELGFEHGAGALGDPTSALTSAPAWSSPGVASLGAAPSLVPSLDDARPSMGREPTPAAATPVGTRPRARSEPAPAAAASSAPPSRIRAATATQELPGQQTRIFYFFSPHCPYCAQQTPLLNAFVQGRRDVVGVAMDTDRDELLAHVQQMHMTFPVTLDQGESKTFGVTAYPALVVLDATGNARRLQGLVTRSDLQRMLGGGT